MNVKSHSLTLKIFAAHQTSVDIAVGQGDRAKFLKIEIQKAPEENKRNEFDHAL